jgi:uracil-DNA glycosylase
MKISQFLTEKSWQEVLGSEFKKDYFKDLEKTLIKTYETDIVYPAKENIFRALNLTPFDKVKVVILGQDPYHGVGQAHGLSFSVNKGVKIPPSLVNIYKELHSDLTITSPNHGFLESWAKEGVLLLNNQLTVLEGKPMSHKDIGWDEFTNKIIELLNNHRSNLVFILWGSPAHKKAMSVDEKKHFVIKSVHPSPLSSYRGFFGSKPFSKANDYLKKQKIAPINWAIN